jgi:hypothetical protein
VAVIVTCHVVKNDRVVTVKLAVVLPAGMVMLAGIPVTRVLLVFSEMITPPAGAALLKVTVPVTDVPPATLTGLTDNDESKVGAVMVRVAVLLTPL